MNVETRNSEAVTRDMDRHNSWVFAISHLLIYFASPVVYVGIVQAALCDKLGASAAVANLPNSAYFLGFFFPVILSWTLAYRFERTVVVAANLVTSSSLVLVALSLFLPVADSIRLGVVIGQGLVLGLADSSSIVYMYQCLKRGTSLKGRARCLKWTFAFTPILAVVGNLLAQFILGGGIPALSHPKDFGLLYLMAAGCTGGVAFLATRFRLVDIPEKKPPFAETMKTTFRSYLQVRTLFLIWIAYLLLFLAWNSTTNLSLYSREALGADPKDYAGYMNALRFGFKAVTGFALGVIMIRWGIRAPLVTTVLLTAAGILWAWVVPGHAFLMAFAFMGGGELAGAYFPNYVISVSAAAAAARNNAFLSLVLPVSSFAPALHGALTDAFGFPASFGFGLAMAALALALVLCLPKQAETIAAKSHD